ncbi:hypothetical protein [Flavobacterium sp. H122]|uniref:hypothetical protein n=1 Tax=Flavobacterium sp. H122 TaxID=2529860 RepID=UPI0010AAAA50|nr:hypothetical protein [Flavobacterium sp. H122]
MNKDKVLNTFPLNRKLRFTENLHIVFWLLKDLSWCLEFKSLALIMTFPTLAVGIYILIKDKEDISEIYHNLAIILWIIANSWWMCSEFFHFDEKKIFYSLTGRELAVIPFGLGIIILAVFYLIIYPKRRLNN